MWAVVAREVCSSGIRACVAYRQQHVAEQRRARDSRLVLCRAKHHPPCWLGLRDQQRCSGSSGGHKCGGEHHTGSSGAHCRLDKSTSVSVISTAFPTRGGVRAAEAGVISTTHDTTLQY